MDTQNGQDVTVNVLRFALLRWLSGNQNVLTAHLACVECGLVCEFSRTTRD
jgi:hypothetical protein